MREIAINHQLFAAPKSDRWHKKPTALLGGVAIFLAITITSLSFLPWSPELLTILGCSSLLFLVGLVDDIRHLKPYQKLIGQVMAAAVVVTAGLVLPWTPWPVVNIAITVIWLVGITNAVNLLDNMDGLAAGVAAIACVFLGLHFWINGNAMEAQLLAIMAAALLGFLVYNSHPASIFMGDCGSMYIGFFLGSAALLDTMGGKARSFLPVLAVPVLVLFIPIFDITLVTIIRKLSGRGIAQGGRDHASHRLVALGLTERKAVALLYALATLAGLLSMYVVDLSVDVSVALIFGFTVGLTMLGVYLASVKVYDEADVRAAQAQPLSAFLINLSHKRRIFEVFLDVALIGLAYYAATVLILGPLSNHEVGANFEKTLPILIGVKLAVFLVMGVYRGLWRYVSIENLLSYTRATILASLVSVLAVFMIFRLQGFSRAVFVLDGFVLLTLVCGSRIAFRLLRRMLPGNGNGDGQRSLIYGAGDAGELLVRELQNNPALGCAPIGFLDDDPLKKGKMIHGLRVFGGNGSFLEICEQQKVAQVLISSQHIPSDRIREIQTACESVDVGLKRMRIEIEELGRREE